MISRKSQTGVEYLIIVSILLIILTVIFVYVKTQYTDSTRIEQASDAVRSLVSAADRIYSIGPGAKTFVYVTLPDGIISTNISKKEIVIKMRTSAGELDILDSTLGEINGSIPKDSGIHKIDLLVLESGVVLIGENLAMTVDTEDPIPPIVTFVPPTPADGVNVYVGIYLVNVTVTDNLGPITSCTLYWDGEPQTMAMLGYGANVTCYSPIYLLTGGSHTYYVAAFDTLNTAKTETRTITVKRKGVKDAMINYYIDVDKGVVGNDVPENQIEYRLWNKIAFGSEFKIDANESALGTFTLVSNPIRNEKILLFRENTTPSSTTENPHAYAAVWNGTGWTSLIRLTWANGHTRFPGMYDVAYEQISGNAVVVYADDSVCPGYVAYRVWNGNVWSAPQDFPSGTYQKIPAADGTDGYTCLSAIEYIRLASNPLKNEITSVILTEDQRLIVDIWYRESGCKSEVCDGYDNDCDGQIDEDLTQSCPLNQGVCAGAENQTCTSGVWSACYYGTNYSAGTEICIDGRDNDCNGDTDEGCPKVIDNCMEAPPSSGGVEICNGFDDDCDGQVDENLVQNCPLQYGVCAGATQTCANGNWNACNYGGNYEQNEISCDGLDNDCSGIADEGCPKVIDNCMGVPYTCVQYALTCLPLPATCGSAECVALGCMWDDPSSNCMGIPNSCSFYNNNLPMCVNVNCIWTPGMCQDVDSDGYTPPPGLGPPCMYPGIDCNDNDASIYPGGVEFCDGVDNDCNWQVDENLIQNCPLQYGVCAGATRTCANGNWGACNYGGNYEQNEISCDSLDNDCDGYIDEGCPQAICMGPPYTCDQYALTCLPPPATCGKTECVTLGCQWNILSSDCTGTANNCSFYNNNIPLCVNANCIWTPGMCQDADSDGYAPPPGFMPPGGVPLCVYSGVDCNDNDASIYPGGVEICDNNDNDCDWQTDENLNQNCPLQYGVCAGATQSCSLGTWGTCDYGDDYEYAETSCDGLDNDCDGYTDEGCPPGGGSAKWANHIVLTNNMFDKHSQDFDVAYEQNSGRAMVIWQENLANGPSYSIWNGAGWSAIKRASLIGAEGVWYELDTRRNYDGLLLTVLDTNRQISAQFWDGSSWGASASLMQNVLCGANTKCFGAAYEQISIPPRALVAYNFDGGPSTQLGTSFWNGSMWLNPTSSQFAPTPPTPLWVTIEPDVYSDEIFIVNTEADGHMHARLWDPETGIISNILSATAQIVATEENFAISFDRQP